MVVSIGRSGGHGERPEQRDNEKRAVATLSLERRAGQRRHRFRVACRSSAHDCARQLRRGRRLTVAEMKRCFAPPFVPGPWQSGLAAVTLIASACVAPEFTKVDAIDGTGGAAGASGASSPSTSEGAGGVSGSGGSNTDASGTTTNSVTQTTTGSGGSDSSGGGSGGSSAETSTGGVSTGGSAGESTATSTTSGGTGGTQ